ASSGLHLGEGAVGRRLVVAPADDLGAVADAPAARVVEGDLDDKLGPERHPLHLLLALPAGWVAVAAVTGLVRLQPLEQVLLLRGLDPRGMSDDTQRPFRVVEAQHQRADRPRVLTGPVAGDDAVDRAHALDLHHAGARSGLVERLQILGDDALAMLEPGLAVADVSAQRGDRD